MIYTFAVNKVSDKGAHEQTTDKIAVSATTEELARSVARTELGKRSAGTLRFAPGYLISTASEPTIQGPKPAEAREPATKQ